MPDFVDVLIPYPPYILSGNLYHGQILIGPDYNILTYTMPRKLRMLPPLL